MVVIISPANAVKGSVFLITVAIRPCQSLGDLKNGNLFIHDEKPGNGVPQMWLDTFLVKQGLTRSKYFFTNIKEVDKVSQAVLPVFFKQADACLVSRSGFETMVELNPQIGEQLAIQATSPGFILGGVFFRRDFRADIKKLIMDTCMKFSTYSWENKFSPSLRPRPFLHLSPLILRPCSISKEYADLQSKKK